MSERTELSYHLEQLAMLCEEHPIGEKWIFVPSAQIGYNVGGALAAAGIRWINLHLTTPAACAEQLAGPALRASGWRPLVQDADFFFVHDLVGQIEWPPDHPFASGLSREGVSRTFLKTLRALRDAGIEPRQLDSGRLRNGVLLRDLYTSYSDWLLRNRLYDQAHLYSEAGALVRAGPERTVGIFDETPLSGAALRFVDALSSGKMVRIGREGYGLSLPQQCAAIRLEDAPLVGGGSIGRGGRTATDGLTPEDAATIQLREAIGVENEVRGILRDLLSIEAPLDSLEMAYTSEDPYLALILDMADRLDLPITSASGVPVVLTNPGQSLLHFFRWIAAGHDADELVRLCRSGLLSTRREEIPSSEVGRIVEEARIGPGITVYREALLRLEARRTPGDGAPASNARRKHADREVRDIRTATAVLDRLYGLCPPANTVSLRELCDAGVAYLNEFAPVRRERDERARESLQDRLKELAAAVEIAGSAGEIAGILATMISDHKVEASVARPGHIYVVPLSRAGYSGRERVAVVGLAETTFPGAASEDPILLDDERRSLSQELPLERGRSSEAGWHLVRVLGMAPGTVVLTANRRTTTEGRETYPSALYQQIAKQLGVKHPPVDHAVTASEKALDEAELVLSVRHSPGVDERLQAGRSWLAAGRLADLERRSPVLGRYHGWLGERTPELRPGADAALSVSSLEDLAACPYRYFLKNVLSIRPPEKQEEAPGRWLTPLDFGKLLHSVLKELMETIATRQERVDGRLHQPLLEEILDRHIDAMRELVPVMYATGFRVDVARLRRAGTTFLNEESRREAEPVGFEVSFGLGANGMLDTPDPVSVRLSERVRLLLRGSIDRVDRTAGGYEVWDYKSGSTFDFDEFDLLSGGRRLQWALYAYVLEEILERKGIVGRTGNSGYVFMSDRENGLRLAQAPPPREEVAQRIEPLLDMIEEGGFLHIQKSNACTYCDYAGICASERQDEKNMDEIFSSTPVDRQFLGPLRKWMNG